MALALTLVHLVVMFVAFAVLILFLTVNAAFIAIRMIAQFAFMKVKQMWFPEKV
jgi:hypothetical protein